MDLNEISKLAVDWNLIKDVDELHGKLMRPLYVLRASEAKYYGQHDASDKQRVAWARLMHKSATEIACAIHDWEVARGSIV